MAVQKGAAPLSSKKTFKVYGTDGLFKVSLEVPTLDLAVEKSSRHWPCRIKAAHLPYQNGVLVDADGTVDFSAGKVEIKEAFPNKREM